MRESLDFIISGSEVTRYHTVTTLVKETVGHHSHGVALLTTLLAPTASRSLLLAALCHDLAEHLTGDIPSPAKRELGVGDRIDELEARLMKSAGIEMPDLSDEEARILKLADIAQGALFCAREISMGNTRMQLVFDRYMNYANEMILIGREKELFNVIKEKVQ